MCKHFFPQTSQYKRQIELKQVELVIFVIFHRRTQIEKKERKKKWMKEAQNVLFYFIVWQENKETKRKP